MQALESYTLDSESYQQLICYLDTLTPFEAIRQAEGINKVNGFEIVSRVEVGKWKKSVNHFQKIKFACDKADFNKIIFQKSNLVIPKEDSNRIRIEKSNLDFAKGYQKAYMKLLSC